MEECGSRYGGIILDPDGNPQPCKKLSAEELQEYIPVLLEAWGVRAYRERLLTFEEGKATDWYWYKNDRQMMLKRTRDALESKGVKVGASENPIVLSDAQFTRNVYRMQDKSEVVLRLPDFPFLLRNSNLQNLSTNSSFAAFAIDSHVCGM